MTGEGQPLRQRRLGSVRRPQRAIGMGLASLGFTGFGTAWLDFDNDGRLDLLSVNGAVQVIESLRQAGDPLPPPTQAAAAEPWRRPLRGRDGSCGAALALSEIGRGAAFGDVDNDGDVDVLVGNNNGPTRLLVNRMARRHWVGLRLTGATGRDMLGARAEVLRPVAASSWRRARADGSYASANDPRVLVGLADAADVRTVRVTWPAGKTEAWTQVPVDQHHAGGRQGPVKAPRSIGVVLLAALACASIGCRADRQETAGAPDPAGGVAAGPVARGGAGPGAHPDALRLAAGRSGSSRRHRQRTGECLRRDGKAVHRGRVLRPGPGVPGQCAAAEARRDAVAVSARPRVSVQERDPTGQGRLCRGGEAGAQSRTTLVWLAEMHLAQSQPTRPSRC